jgi:hypothetical protein
MSRVSLEELFRHSVTFPGPGLRMAGLEQVRTAMEEQLDYLKGQRAIRLYARLKRQARNMAEDDIDYELHELKSAVDELFPKVLRGGFVVALWSVFEACVKDLAEYTRREKKLPFGLQELRAGDFLEQMELFFSRVLGLAIFKDKGLRARLSEIKGLRNALAHHDGSVDELPKSLQGKSEAEFKIKGLRVYKDLHHRYVVPSAEYVEESVSTVSAYLSQLSQQVYVALHPVPLEDDA